MFESKGAACAKAERNLDVSLVGAYLVLLSRRGTQKRFGCRALGSGVGLRVWGEWLLGGEGREPEDKEPRLRLVSHSKCLLPPCGLRECYGPDPFFNCRLATQRFQ